MDIKIATYHSEDCPVAADTWTARLYINGVRDFIAMYAPTQAAVIEKAESQRDLYIAKMAGNMVMIEAKATQTIEGAAETQVKDYQARTGAGRGAHFSGTKWVIHRGKRDKKRIPASEVDTYLAKGYEIGGPRSQF